MDDREYDDLLNDCFGPQRDRSQEELVLGEALRPSLVPDSPEMPPITCPECLRTSHHPMDVREGYCGNCHAFTSTEAYQEAKRLKRYEAGKTELVDEIPAELRDKRSAEVVREEP